MSHPLIKPSTAPLVYRVVSLPPNKQYVTDAVFMRDVFTLRGGSCTDAGPRRTVRRAEAVVVVWWVWWGVLWVRWVLWWVWWSLLVLVVLVVLVVWVVWVAWLWWGITAKADAVKEVEGGWWLAPLGV
jgi:hypothetical protein